MAFHLLQEGRGGARALAEALTTSLDKVGRCKRCRMLTEGELCETCLAPQRDASLVCVVESPADVVAVEQSGSYRGRYFVLMGHLSPLDGIGPEQLGIRELEGILDEGGVEELILATNPTVEGEATAVYLSRLLKPLGLSVTRIAMGIPVGSDLEFADEVTMSKSLENRREM